MGDERRHIRERLRLAAAAGEVFGHAGGFAFVVIQDRDAPGPFGVAGDVELPHPETGPHAGLFGRGDDPLGADFEGDERIALGLAQHVPGQEPAGDPGAVDGEHGRHHILGPGRREDRGERLAEMSRDLLDFLELPGDVALDAPVHERVAEAQHLGNERGVAGRRHAVPV